MGKGMGKKPVINGKDLFDSILTVNLQGLYFGDNSNKSLLKQLRKDNDFISDWKILLSWRPLKTEEKIKQFFRVHSFLRSDELSKRLNKFSNDIGASFALAKEFFITGKVSSHAEEETDDKTSVIEKAIKELVDYKNKLYFISQWDFSMYVTGKHEIPEIRKRVEHLNSMMPSLPKSGDEVIEVFGGNNYKKKDLRIQAIQDKKKEFSKIRPKSLGDKINQLSWEDTKPDDFSFIWPKDSAMVLEDRENESPIIYLRIDPRKINRTIINRIKNLIKEKRKESHIKPDSKTRLQFDSWEVALMIYDLKSYGFSIKDITYLISQINEDVEMQFVRDKINTAEDLIKSASTQAFPKFNSL